MKPTQPCIARRRLVAGLAAMSALPAVSFAQDAWPARPIKIIVPLPPGGGVDVLARVMAEELHAQLKADVVIDNKPGGAGVLGVRQVAAAPADGYTLGYGHSGLLTVQAMGAKIDVFQLAWIGRMSTSPFVLAVRADSPYRTPAELVAAMRAQPGTITYGSGGAGTPGHIATAILEDRMGVQGLHIPYKGAIEVATAMAGGQVEFGIGLLSGMAPLAQGGRLRLLAVTSATRVPGFPDLPTLAEAGVPGYAFDAWGGLFAPPGTPEAIVGRLGRLMPTLLATERMKQAAKLQGLLLDYADAKTLGAQLRKDYETEQRLVGKLGLTLNS